MQKKLMVIFLVVLLISILVMFALIKPKINDVSNETEELTKITLDINPSIVVTINSKREVVEVLPYNGDAEQLIAKIDISNKNIDDFLNNVIEMLVEENYLSNEDNIILVNVDSNNTSLKNSIEKALKNAASNNDISLDVIMLTFEPNEALQEEADKYGITLSKAYYIEKQLENNEELHFEDYVNSSINEISNVTTKDDEKNDNKDNKSEETINNDPRVGTLSKCERVVTVLDNDEAANRAISVYGAVLNPGGYCDVRYASSVADIDPNGTCAYKVDFEYMTDKCTYYINISNGEVLNSSKCVKRNISMNDNQCIIMRDLNIKHRENLGLTSEVETDTEFVSIVEDNYGTLNTFEYHISKTTGSIVNKIIIKEFTGPSPYENYPRPDDI